MKSSLNLKFLCPALLLVLLVSARNVSAETLVIKDNTSYDLSGYMDILSDPTNSLTVQQAADRNDWQNTIPGKVPNIGLTGNTIWLRFSFSNRSDIAKKFYISVEYPMISSVFFYTQEMSGSFREEHTGSSTPATSGIVLNRFFLFPLVMEPGRTATVYLCMQSTSSMTLPIRIISDQTLLQSTICDNIIYGALFGLLLLVMLYFMTAGSFLYRGTPVWLILYSFFFGLHMALRGGFIRLILPDAALDFFGLLQLAAISGLFFTGARFFRLFLSLERHSRLLNRIMIFFQYLSLAFILSPLLPMPVIIAVTMILFIVNPVFSIAVAFYFWRKGIPNAGFFAIGWIAAHFVSVFDFFRIHGMLPYQPLGEWPIPFSLFIAMLFISSALIRQNTLDHLMAETDPLTQLANRRKLDEVLQMEWDRCRRLQMPLSVIVADVDNFKKYNDSLGHRAGDQCLRRIADILASNTRRSGDLAVRYGGEEFLLLFPHTDASKAFAIAERIRIAIENYKDEMVLKHSNGKITISMGVATVIPCEEMNPEDFIMEADKAMYEAKHAGRNQTIISKADVV